MVRAVSVALVVALAATTEAPAQRVKCAQDRRVSIVGQISTYSEDPSTKTVLMGMVTSSTTPCWVYAVEAPVRVVPKTCGHTNRITASGRVVTMSMVLDVLVA